MVSWNKWNFSLMPETMERSENTKGLPSSRYSATKAHGWVRLFRGTVAHDVWDMGLMSENSRK